MSSSVEKFKIFSFSGNTKILHMTWFAFFISFFVWFNQNGLLPTHIQKYLGLSNEQFNSLLLLNVILTIPARIIIGMLVDKFGPKTTFSGLLAFASIPCLIYALADSFTQLAIARLLMGFVGAGFVIGIRIISEWFHARQAGIAEGIYGGWGNFGSAAATISLPLLAAYIGGENGWRYAIGFTGLLALTYSIIYFKNVTDTPKGSTYFRPNKSGAMEVTSRRDMWLYIFMTFPLYGALAAATWRFTTPSYGLITPQTAVAIYLALAFLYLYNVVQIIRNNREILSRPIAEIHRYKFKQVAILNISYFVTFGSEIAVVMILAKFFKSTFNVSDFWATVGGGSFMFMNLVARPWGGHLSDRIGRKKSLVIVLACMTAGYVAMSLFSSSWPFFVALAVTVVTSFFVQAGCGAVFALVPLIKRRLTGQIAGMTGAYGNTGSVIFLTIYTLTSAQVLFAIIAVVALGVLLSFVFLEEPKGAIAEVLPDGTVQMIDVE